MPSAEERSRPLGADLRAWYPHRAVWGALLLLPGLARLHPRGATLLFGCQLHAPDVDEKRKAHSRASGVSQSAKSLARRG